MNSVFKGVLKSLPCVINAYFSWINKYYRHKEKYPLELRYQKSRNLITKVMHNFGVNLIIEGEENIPSSHFYLVSNHISALDPLMYIMALEKPISIVSKKEVKKYPIVGKIINIIDGEFIDRDDLKQSLKVMMKVEKDFKENKASWMIFPEGTRNKDPLKVLQPFHSGTFRPAIKSGISILPAAIYGTFRVMDKKCQLKKYPVHIKFLPSINKELYVDKKNDDIASISKNSIQKELSFNLKLKTKI